MRAAFARPWGIWNAAPSCCAHVCYLGSYDPNHWEFLNVCALTSPCAQSSDRCQGKRSRMPFPPLSMRCAPANHKNNHSIYLVVEIWTPEHAANLYSRNKWRFRQIFFVSWLSCIWACEMRLSLAYPLPCLSIVGTVCIRAVEQAKDTITSTITLWLSKSSSLNKINAFFKAYRGRNSKMMPMASRLSPRV